MHGAEKGLNELCGMLKTAEADIRKGTGHVMAIQHKPNFKRKGSSKKKGKDKVQAPGPAAKDECHHCKEKGHWKRNCKLYLASLRDKGSKTTE